MIFIILSFISMIFSLTKSKVVFRFIFFVIATLYVFTFAYGYDWIFYYNIYENSLNIVIPPFEPGMFYLMKTFKYLGLSFPVFIFLINLFIFYGLYLFCNNLKNSTFALFCLISFYSFYMYSEQVRQGIALTIILISITKYDIRSRKSFFMALLACSFHVSAIFYILYSLITKNESKLKRNIILLTMLVFSVIFIFVNPTVISFIPYVGEKIYGYSVAYSATETSFYQIITNSRLAIIYLLLTVLFYLSYRKRIDSSMSNAVLASHFLFLSKLTPFLIRFGYYAIPFMVYGLDSFISDNSNKKKISIYILPIMLCIFSISTIPMWNENYLISTRTNLNVLSNKTDITKEIKLKCNQLYKTGYGTVILPYCE